MRAASNLGRFTRREIRRCLKRYIARYLYRTLNALHDTPATT